MGRRVATVGVLAIVARASRVSGTDASRHDPLTVGEDKENGPAPTRRRAASVVVVAVPCAWCASEAQEVRADLAFRATGRKL